MPIDRKHRLSRRHFLLQSAAAGLCSSLVPPRVQGAAAAPAGQPPGAAPLPDSDVGSLFPIIQAQSVQGEFPLSYLNRKFQSYSRWRKTARAKLLELLHYSPERCAPAAEVLERVDLGDFVREKILFNTTPSIRVPAYVLAPKQATGRGARLPAIVALHDHGGYYLWGKEKLVETENEPAALKNWRKSYYGNQSIASALARQGYVVLVIDMFYWGERRMLLPGDPPDWVERPATIPPERISAFNQRASQSEQLVGRTIFSAGFTWAGLMFWDDIRSVDYLLTRPDVDPNRIGCAGLSVGGLRSCHLAALDDRIKAAVVVGWMASFPRQLRRHVRNTIGHTKVVPGLYRYLDYPDVAALAMPAALLVINGKKDGLFEPGGVTAAFEKLNASYKKAGLADRVRTSLYDAPHEFNAEMQAEAWVWLKKHL